MKSRNETKLCVEFINDETKNSVNYYNSTAQLKTLIHQMHKKKTSMKQTLGKVLKVSEKIKKFRFFLQKRFLFNNFFIQQREFF